MDRMFGSIAGRYDFLNHALSLGVDFYWRRALIKAARPAEENIMRGKLPCILDLAAGTFDVSIALSAAYPDFNVLALDLCLPMLLAGLPKLERNARRAALRKPRAPITPAGGDAFALPLADGSIRVITLAFGLRNMRPRVNALSEMLRVLTPGGKLCVLEFASAEDKIWGGLYNFYLARLLPWFGGVISKDREAYAYLAKSIRELPPPGRMAQEMLEAGFCSARFEALSCGLVHLYTAGKEGAP